MHVAEHWIICYRSQWIIVDPLRGDVPLLTPPSTSLWNWGLGIIEQLKIIQKMLSWFSRGPFFSNLMLNLHNFRNLKLNCSIRLLERGPQTLWEQKHLFFYAHIKKKNVCVEKCLCFFPLDPSGMQIRLFADLSIFMFGFSTSGDLCIKIDLTLSTEHALLFTLICFSLI